MSFKYTRMLTRKRCKKWCKGSYKLRPLPMNLDGSAGKTPDPKFRTSPDLNLSRAESCWCVSKRITYWLIKCVDTTAKCRHSKSLHVNRLCGRCISKFIDCRYSQSCWYFWPSFVNCCPSHLLSGSSLPPPPPPPIPVRISTLYSIYTRIQLVCKGREGWRHRRVGDLRQIP